MDLQDIADIARQKFGPERAAELREDIRQLAEDLEKLRHVQTGLDDEP